MTHSAIETPKLDWKEAPVWAAVHVYQSWGAGFWSDTEPELGKFAHNHGRWWFAAIAKTKASGHELPLNYDYRVSIEYRPIISSQKRPTIVTLCGGTRFSEAYQKANLEETLAGRIVLTIGCDMRTDKELFEGKTQEELIEIKHRLDDLHLWKVELADEVLILSEKGYIGESTARELEYARSLAKKIRFWEEGVVLVDTKDTIFAKGESS